MPYPSQIDRETIIATAIAMLEREGQEALSLGKVAKELGVKTPSLYRYIDGKAGLMQAVITRVNTGLIDALIEAADSDQPPREQLVAVAAAYRSYALAHPNTYMLAMTNTEDAYRPDEDMMVQLVLPIQAMMAEWVGEGDSLAALRGLMGLVHGYATLEIAGQLRRGGDLSATFTQVVEAYLVGWG